MNFNDSFNDTGEKPQFIYKRRVDDAQSYDIFMFIEAKGEYAQVGDYTVIDEDEDEKLSDKKISNLIKLLNGKNNLEELGNLTKTRVLFNIVPNREVGDPIKIILRNHDGTGTSEENAVLTIEKGVINESQFRISG